MTAALKSELFAPTQTSACLLVVDSVTQHTVGLIKLDKDAPKNLSCNVDSVIFTPTFRGTLHEKEAMFMTLAKLFSLGYRRISFSCDSKDSASKNVATSCCFTFEGDSLKDRIISFSSNDIVSSDSSNFAMLNSDWNSGARSHLFSKIFGAKAEKADRAARKDDEEMDERESAVKKNK